MSNNADHSFVSHHLRKQVHLFSSRLKKACDVIWQIRKLIHCLMVRGALGVNPVPTWVGPPPHWHQRFPRIWVPRQYQWSILSGLGVDINNWAGGQSWALKWSLHCRNTPKYPKELHLKLKPLPCHCPTWKVEGSPHRCAQSHSRPFDLAAHQPDWDLCRSGSLQQLPGRSVDHSRRTGRCLGEGF